MAVPHVRPGLVRGSREREESESTRGEGRYQEKREEVVEE